MLTKTLPVDLAQVYITLAPVDEGIEGADHIFAIDAEVEGEVVAGPGRDAGVRQVVLGGDRRHQRLRAVAAGHRQPVGAPPHRGPHQLLELIPLAQLDHLQTSLPRRLREPDFRRRAHPPTRG